MIFVSDAFCLQFPVQCCRSPFEAQIIIVSTVEINREGVEAHAIFPRQHKRVICVPMCLVDRRPKDGSQQITEGRAGMNGGVKVFRGSRNQGGAFSADGSKPRGMRECKS